MFYVCKHWKVLVLHSKHSQTSLTCLDCLTRIRRTLSLLCSISGAAAFSPPGPWLQGPEFGEVTMTNSPSDLNSDLAPVVTTPHCHCSSTTSTRGTSCSPTPYPGTRRWWGTASSRATTSQIRWLRPRHTPRHELKSYINFIRCVKTDFSFTASEATSLTQNSRCTQVTPCHDQWSQHRDPQRLV